MLEVGETPSCGPDRRAPMDGLLLLILLLAAAAALECDGGSWGCGCAGNAEGGSWFGGLLRNTPTAPAPLVERLPGGVGGVGVVGPRMERGVGDPLLLPEMDRSRSLPPSEPSVFSFPMLWHEPATRARGACFLGGFLVLVMVLKRVGKFFESQELLPLLFSWLGEMFVPRPFLMGDRERQERKERDMTSISSENSKRSTERKSEKKKGKGI